ncbi:MAG TPA: hypothetical protein VK420_04175 [Longimicrobium sp.]|nr:hypothetical protein [Longimicrobium sp.]
MYRHCIYCSAEMGANEALEGFPVGRTLAFDAEKGRLWAVCGRCARWNLAPIEERWEPVEDAERLFRDARMRVQSENIGLARLADGTRLIRVGAALHGELAAWRYGDQLMKRRRRHRVLAGAATVAGIVGFAGVAYAAVGYGTFYIAHNIGRSLWKGYLRSRPFHTLAPHETPDGRPVTLQRKHLEGAVLQPGAEGGVELRLPGAVMTPSPQWKGILVESPIILADPAARRVLERGMVHLNASGADRQRLGHALGLIASAGSAEEYISGTASSHLALARGDEAQRWMPADTALALEIALHEEQERRALAGELSILEAAWRDAEPIAEIADRLSVEGS